MKRCLICLLALVLVCMTVSFAGADDAKPDLMAAFTPKPFFEKLFERMDLLLDAYGEENEIDVGEIEGVKERIKVKAWGYALNIYLIPSYDMDLEYGFVFNSSDLGKDQPASTFQIRFRAGFKEEYRDLFFRAIAETIAERIGEEDAEEAVNGILKARDTGKDVKIFKKIIVSYLEESEETVSFAFMLPFKF